MVELHLALLHQLVQMLQQRSQAQLVQCQAHFMVERHHACFI
jgi:hypothetical protein